MPADASPSSRALERILTHPETVQLADLPQVHQAGLSGFVRARLPTGHPLREKLRPGTLDLALRHEYLRGELRPLLRAWQQAGIPFVLMKGFALAEFEYATRGERFHGDVDLLLPGDFETVQRAQLLALAHGWRSDGMHTAPETWTHETMHLYGPGGQVRLDVHRHVFSGLSGFSKSRIQTLTKSVWERAITEDWDGFPVRRFHPLDAAVYVPLGRTWGGDAGGMKPADYTDLLVLTENHHFTPGELERHASAWGGRETWRTFMSLCNPWQRQLSLAANTIQAPLLDAALQDGASRRRGIWKIRLKNLKLAWPHLPQGLFDVLAAWWAVQGGGDPRRHLARWTPQTPPHPAEYRTLAARIDVINWWTRLLYPKQRRLGVCVPRAYASYRALRQIGHPAVFFSGVARSETGVVGHAWIEDNHGEMELYEVGNRQRFKVLLKFPEAP